jgi:hypothetical protein
MGWLDPLREGYQRLRLQTRFALHLVLLVAVLFALLIPAVLLIQESAILATARDNGLHLVTMFAFSSVPPWWRMIFSVSASWSTAWVGRGTSATP